jgi:hypothetical protein
MSDRPDTKARAEALVESWRPYFVAEYERDSCNTRRQTFDEYWRWVKTFLLVGGSGHAGWLAQTTSAVANVRDEAAKQALSARSQTIGKQIAGEWAKDSACRKIYSNPLQGRPNLLDWGRKLQRAASRDRGDGHEIAAALKAVESEFEAASSR